MLLLFMKNARFRLYWCCTAENEFFLPIIDRIEPAGWQVDLLPEIIDAYDPGAELKLRDASAVRLMARMAAELLATK